MKIIDVRPKAQFLEQHIKGSQNSEFNQLDDFLAKADIDEDYIFVCNRGIASMKAAKKAKSLGFNNVKSLAGGMTAWNEKYLPREKHNNCKIIDNQ